MATTTIITTREGKIIENSGTSGFTITLQRTGENVHAQTEFDIATLEEAIAGVGLFLALLDELHGENFVAQCFNHYAEATGKPRMENRGGRDIVRIRGYKDGRR